MGCPVFIHRSVPLVHSVPPEQSEGPHSCCFCSCICSVDMFIQVLSFLPLPVSCHWHTGGTQCIALAQDV